MRKNLWESIKNAFSGNWNSGERNGGGRFEIPWPLDAADLADFIDHIDHDEVKNRALAEGIRYPLEYAAMLSESEKDAMQDEWDLTSNVPTASFYRFFSQFFYLCERDILETVFMEVRYEDAVPDAEKMLALEERLGKKLRELEKEYDNIGDTSDDYRQRLQSELKQEIRESMEKTMPEVRITEILVVCLAA